VAVFVRVAGTGSTYGEPRRIAQEALRTASTLSELDAQHIDERLKQLRGLIATPPLPVGSDLFYEEDAVAILRRSCGVYDVGAGTSNAAAPPATARAGSAAKPDDKAKSAKPAAGAAAGKPGAAAAVAATPAAVDPALATAPTLVASDAPTLAERERLASSPPFSVAQRICQCITVLRDAVFKRAVYLQALKTETDHRGAPHVFYLPFVSLAASPVAPSLDDVDAQVLSAGSATAPATGLPVFDAATSAYPAPRDAASVLLRQAPSAPTDGAAIPPAYHTLKGVSPSTLHATMSARKPLTSEVADALQQCLAATKDLFAAEGVDTAAASFTLPASATDFVQREKSRMNDFHDYSLRRLREQVIELDGFLHDAPAAIASDVTERTAATVAATTRALTLSMRPDLEALQAKRKDHAARLRLNLADPNHATDLDALVAAEAQRAAETDALLTRARSQEEDAHKRAVARAAIDIAHSVNTCVMLVEDVVKPDDLKALPGESLSMRCVRAYRRCRLRSAANPDYPRWCPMQATKRLNLRNHRCASCANPC